LTLTLGNRLTGLSGQGGNFTTLNQIGMNMNLLNQLKVR